MDSRKDNTVYPLYHFNVCLIQDALLRGLSSHRVTMSKLSDPLFPDCDRWMSSLTIMNSSVVIFLILLVGFIGLSLESLGLTHFSQSVNLSSGSKLTAPKVASETTSFIERNEKFDFTVVSQSRYCYFVSTNGQLWASVLFALLVGALEWVRLSFCNHGQTSLYHLFPLRRRSQGLPAGYSGYCRSKSTHDYRSFCWQSGAVPH